MRFPVPALTFLSSILLLGCFGDTEEVFPTVAPGASPVPVETETSATPSAGGRPVTGLFTEPRPRPPDATVNLPPRPPSPFQPWDRMAVVVYDIEQGTEVNFGPGLVPSFSEDGGKLAMNPVSPNVAPAKVRVIDLATNARREFDSPGGLAGFVDNNHLYLPGPGEIRVLDIRTGETTPLSQVSDPLLREKLQGRGTGAGRLSPNGTYSLVGGPRAGDFCRDRPESEAELCRAEAFEQWQVLEVASSRVVLEFRAVQADFAGPGEIVLATSPQCTASDGTRKWCAQAAEELRADDPPGQFPNEYAEGTTNVFLLDIARGAAEFVATAVYGQHSRATTTNWPLIANANHVAWTGAFCGPEQVRTQVFDRARGRLIELDASLWIEFMANGDLGVDEFGPGAILDIETFEWRLVLPDNAIDVVKSPNGRYLAVGSVLGHGGLCP